MNVMKKNAKLKHLSKFEKKEFFNWFVQNVKKKNNIFFKVTLSR